MPRKRDPRRDEARNIWLNSGKTAKLRDIARQLDMPEKTISAWKSKDNWSAIGAERSTAKNKGSTTKGKVGAPYGNKNGKGAPKGNKRAVTTGAYETLFFDCYDEAERELVLSIDYSDKKSALQQQIQTMLVRERRMLQRIASLRAGHPMITRTTSTTARPSGGKTADGRDATVVEKITQESETYDDRILRIEDALTKVQAELRRCIDSLRMVEESEIKQTEMQEGKTTESVSDVIIAAFNKRMGEADDD